MKHGRGYLYLAVFAVSVALIAFEVSLLQVLSIVQWHHFASLIISVALLGFGASGTLIALARRWLLDRFDRVIPLLLAACAVSIAVAVPLSQMEAARFDSYLIFIQGRHAAAFALTCLILFVPFFLGALAIGLTFVRDPQDIGRLYLWNLLGSGLGSLVALVFMWWAAPQTIAPIMGLVAAAGAVAAATGVFRAEGGRSRVTWIVVAVAPVLCIGLALNPPELKPSQFKDISRALDLPDAKIESQRLSPQGLIQVVSSTVTRQAPGLSLHYHGELPVRDLVFLNGDAIGPVSQPDDSDSLHILDYTTRATAYEMHSVRNVLVLGSGTGESVRHAAKRGVQQVRAIEPIQELTSIWTSTWLGQSHISPGQLRNGLSVQTHAVAPRTWIESDTNRYDLIVLPETGRFGGTIGLKALEEDYLLTREALLQIWNRLEPDGLLTVTVWLDYPYRHALRLLAGITDALGHKVASPRNHIAALRSWADVTFVISKAPIGAEMSERIRLFGRRLGFDPLLLPDIRSEEQTRFNRLQDASLLEYMDALLGSDRLEFIQEYPFRIGPTTDDRPFHAQFMRWSQISSLVDQFGDQTLPFFGLGMFIAVLALLQVVALSILLIVAPLFRLRTEPVGRWQTLIYFGALGLGYLFVEIVFIQRFTLLLGHPVFAVTAVIGTMLIGSGIGSYFSSRVAATPQTVARAAGLVVVLVLLYVPLLNVVFGSAVSLSLGSRAVISLLLILPPAVAMGFPFPLGLRLVAERAASQVPWAWGINGCLSVVGAAGAALLAVEFGFSIVMVLAAVVYAVGGWTFTRSVSSSD